MNSTTIPRKKFKDQKPSHRSRDHLAHRDNKVSILLDSKKNLSINPQINCHHHNDISTINNVHSQVNTKFEPSVLNKGKANPSKDLSLNFKNKKKREYKIIVNGASEEIQGYVKKIFIQIKSPAPKILEDDFSDFDQCEYSLASFKEKKMKQNLKLKWGDDGEGDMSFDSESDELEMDNKSLLSKLMRDDTGVLAKIGIKKIGLDN